MHTQVGVHRSTSLRSEGSGSLTPFPDVRLGSLLGRGSYGNVYLGHRGQTAIAVKVQSCVRFHIMWNVTWVTLASNHTNHAASPAVRRTFNTCRCGCIGPACAI